MSASLLARAESVARTRLLRAREAEAEVARLSALLNGGMTERQRQLEALEQAVRALARFLPPEAWLVHSPADEAWREVKEALRTLKPRAVGARRNRT